jgi:hypothetical protein
LCISNLAEGWWNLTMMSNLGMSCRIRKVDKADAYSWDFLKIFVVSRILFSGHELVHCNKRCWWILKLDIQVKSWKYMEIWYILYYHLSQLKTTLYFLHWPSSEQYELLER